MTPQVKNNGQGIVLFYREGVAGESAAVEKVASLLTYTGITGREQVVKTRHSGADMADELCRVIKHKGFSKVLLAGTLPRGFFQAEDFKRSIAELSGLTESGVSLVPFPQRSSEDEGLVSSLTDEITRTYKVLDMLPVFENISVPMSGAVLVLGGGYAGVQAAMELAALGHEVTLIEKSPVLGGGNPLFRLEKERLEGIRVFTNCELIGLDGSLGAFKARIRYEDEKEKKLKDLEIDCGGLVIAVGSATADRRSFPLQSPLLVSLDNLKSLVLKLKRKSEMLRIGIILDYSFPETTASMEQALQAAVALQKQYERQVTVFLRDARVSNLHLESLYGTARDRGVVMVKYEGKPGMSESSAGLTVEVTDCILGKTISVPLTIAGISTRGLSSETDGKVLDLTGVFPDSLGQAQDNNIHALPVETNIPGIAVVGSARGSHYLPRIADEVKAAVEYVRGFIKNPSLRVENSHALVDPDKCVLCLTCVRSCPMGAMRVNREKGAAESLAHVCRRCGICMGECPAKAIELPVYTDTSLLFQATAE